MWSWRPHLPCKIVNQIKCWASLDLGHILGFSGSFWSGVSGSGRTSTAERPWQGQQRQQQDGHMSGCCSRGNQSTSSCGRSNHGRTSAEPAAKEEFDVSYGRENLICIRSGGSRTAAAQLPEFDTQILLLVKNGCNYFINRIRAKPRCSFSEPRILY